MQEEKKEREREDGREVALLNKKLNFVANAIAISICKVEMKK